VHGTDLSQGTSATKLDLEPWDRILNPSVMVDDYFNIASLDFYTNKNGTVVKQIGRSDAYPFLSQLTV
jgi:hypothetical protein